MTVASTLWGAGSGEGEEAELDGWLDPSWTLGLTGRVKELNQVSGDMVVHRGAQQCCGLSNVESQRQPVNAQAKYSGIHVGDSGGPQSRN